MPAVMTNYVKTNFSKSKLTRSIYGGQPNEPDFPYPDKQQCTAGLKHKLICKECGIIYKVKHNYKHTRICPVCSSTNYIHARCKNVAEDGYSVCKTHGANDYSSRDKEKYDMMNRNKITTGMQYMSLMLCPCSLKKQGKCDIKVELVDKERFGTSVPRCILEVEFYDFMYEYFTQKYNLDDGADQLLLNRLIMSTIRVQRGERLITFMEELVERERQLPDGSIDTWLEANPISSVMKSLDSSILSFMKELNITRAARQGKKKIIQNTNINLTNLLNKKEISETEVIDSEDLENENE